MNEVCGMHGEEIHTGLWWGNLKETDRLVEPSADGG